MKSITYRIFTTLMLCAGLAGCAGVPQESAMQWLQNQRMLIDP